MPRHVQNKVPKISLERQLVILSLCSTLPLLVLLIWVFIISGVSGWLIALTLFLALVTITYTTYQIYVRSVYHFRSLSNLLDAMIAGDYTMRARLSKGFGALDQLSHSINQLAERLMQQRVRTVESQKLLETVIEYIDVAIIALNEKGHVRFVNAATRSLFHLETEADQKSLIRQLLFAQEFVAGQADVVELVIGSSPGKYKVHVESFRESGEPNLLLFITDVHELLRTEQNQAWQSLVRVISHEINNSLSPIASISDTLNKIVNRQQSRIQSAEEIISGLSIIAQRAKGLSSFVKSYNQLAKLPAPEKELCSLADLIGASVAMCPDSHIQPDIPQDLEICIDKAQMQQVFINLMKNAHEAQQSGEHASEPIIVRTAQHYHQIKIEIVDKGQGIANPENLFVPFYTTKKTGSGIGLLLSRQIVEAHGGRLSLFNNDSGGATALIELPTLVD